MLIVPSSLMLALFALVPAQAATGAVGADPGVQKTWVFFHNKGVPSAELPARLAALAGEYDQHATARRALRRTRPGLFDESDLPVAPAYIDAITATGATVHVTSRWLNAASVLATPAQLAQIRALPFVQRTQPVRGGRRAPAKPMHTLAAGASAGDSPGGGLLGDGDPSRNGTSPGGGDLSSNGGSSGSGGSGGDGGIASAFYGWADEQLTQINLEAVHDAGYTAGGVIVGVLDTGFLRTHVAFSFPGHALNVVAEHDFINNDGNTANEPGDDPDQHWHGTFILGVLGAYKPNELVGGAYNASFILCKTEDVTSETPIEEDNYVAGLEFIEQHGGDVATSSLGYIDWYTQADLDGQTAVTTIAVNIATDNGLVCCTAAGNSGHDADPQTSHLIAPADALKVLTSGAVDSGGSIASFSSDGPTADGRVKPELLSRGVATRTVHPGNDTGYVEVSGTSLSTPVLACAAACLVGAHPEWSVTKLRNQLMYTASYYAANQTFEPTYVNGYGIVNAFAALTLADCNNNGVADAQDLLSGELHDLNGDSVPDECVGAGDMNCDGTTNTFDIQGFITALSGESQYNAAYPDCVFSNGDCNGDGTVNPFDIQSFLTLLGAP